jgi:hypothetical protein
MRNHVLPLPQLIATTLFLAGLGGPLLAEQPTMQPVDECKQYAPGGKDNAYVCFDHKGQQWIKAEAELTKAGDPLAIVIIHTNPEHIVAQAAPVKAGVSAQALCPTTGHLVKTIFPDKGRYTLEINVTACDDLSHIPPTEFKVDVLGWQQSVAGAFIGSGHRNPLYSVYSREIDGQTQTFVDQDPSNREDAARLGLGSFIHLYDERWERWQATHRRPSTLLPDGFSFGLGIGSQNSTLYALGLSWRFGDKGFLTAGYSWAPIDRLPNGIHTCPRSAETCDSQLAVTDSNSIANLGSRTARAWFIGLSYTFLDVGTFFQNRFREAINAGAPKADENTSASDLTGDMKAAVNKKNLHLVASASKVTPGSQVTLTAFSDQATSDDPFMVELSGDFEVVDSTGWTSCSPKDQNAQCFELTPGAVGKKYALGIKLTGVQGVTGILSVGKVQADPVTVAADNTDKGPAK